MRVTILFGVSAVHHGTIWSTDTLDFPSSYCENVDVRRFLWENAIKLILRLAALALHFQFIFHQFSIPIVLMIPGVTLAAFCLRTLRYLLHSAIIVICH